MLQANAAWVHCPWKDQASLRIAEALPDLRMRQHLSRTRPTTARESTNSKLISTSPCLGTLVSIAFRIESYFSFSAVISIDTLLSTMAFVSTRDNLKTILVVAVLLVIAMIPSFSLAVSQCLTYLIPSLNVSTCSILVFSINRKVTSI